VVAHQAIGEQFHSPTLMDFRNGVNKGCVVRLVKEDSLSGTATIHDVIDGSGILNSKWPRHDQRHYYSSAVLSTKDLTPHFLTLTPAWLFIVSIRNSARNFTR
jgi:hypothetical protein